jgi:hypothetical protein
LLDAAPANALAAPVNGRAGPGDGAAPALEELTGPVDDAAVRRDSL